MFLDARRIDDRSELECDLCVVGAGAAGITIARELAGSGLKVCVLESGGLEPDAETQALYVGENAGHPYRLHEARLRYFGGTTNHWRGWCRPLDDIDFEERDGIPHSGWPLRRADLDPYYERAHAVCQLGRRTYDPADWAEITETRPFRPTRDVESAVFQVSPPTRFGQAYREDLERSRDVRVVLHANVVGLDASRDGARVTRAQVATLDGTRFAVRARRLVLAAGAIENTRLLLASNDVHRRGLGNEHDLVGRFFADHPHMQLGSVLLPTRRRALAFYDVHPSLREPRAEGALVTTDRFVRSERLLRSCMVRLPHPASPPLGEQVRAVTRDLGGRDLGVSRMLELRAEQVPNLDSRVTLSTALDPLGMPKVRLDWRFTELDRTSALRSLAAIAGALGSAGLARIHNRALLDEGFWSSFGGGAHHLGTTRMHRDARRGVVDANCRVHGVSNLYVAGSAVFPTTGFANPTLTIVALALRLAEHLRGSAG